MPHEAATRHTFHNELWRSLPSGIIDTLPTTFGMLIAVRVFHLGDLAKSIFLSATSGGLITSLFVVPLLLKARSTISRTAAKVQILGGAFMAMSALLYTSPVIFITGLSLGLFCFSMQIPLMTQIYRLNYPEAARGKLYALTGVTRAASAMLFGLVGGWLLGLNLDNYIWLLWAFAISGGVSGWWTYGLPSCEWETQRDQNAHLLSALHWVRDDKDFRTLLISWMIMGVGNLIASCLFVEYLANPRHGIDLPESTVAWIIGVVPLVFRMLCSYPWGLIYDRMGLFKVRSILNVFFAAAILTFYLGHGITAWSISMALWGIANAGGNVVWSLWVTKLAPKHAVAEYMSVHTFLTGLRGVIAPYMAFALIKVMSFEALSIWSSLGILSASAFITVRARSSESDVNGRLSPGSVEERL